MKNFVFRSWMLFCLVAFITISSCVKENFDSPPRDGVDPEIRTDQIISLPELLSQFYIPGKFVEITVDKYLKGIVVSDDKDGNIYKLIYIHDENSELGISLSIDETNMGNIYPIGRRVFVKLKGLTISDNNGNPQIGFGINLDGTRPSLGRIPTSLLAQSVIPGMYNFEVKPRLRTINTLSPSDVNTLVRLEGMQFVTIGDGVTYAPSDPPQNVNVNITDCDNNVIILRNSGYSKFANQNVPSKNGTVTAIYGVFGTTKQLFIRSAADVVFDKERCGGGGGPSGEKVTIENLRSQFTGTAKTLTSGFLQGIVISDIANKNINAQNVIVQDGEFGILCRFKSAVNIPLGTEVKVGLTGGSLSEFNNILQVQNLENTSVEVVASGKTVAPKILTVSQIDISKHESTLIKIENATLIGGAKLSDSGIKVKDASGEIAIFTFATSTFGALVLPSGTITITAIVSDFTSGKQISIRNPGDITGGGPCDVNVATADCDGDGVANGQDCSPSNPAIFPGGLCNDGNAATVNDQYDAQCVCKGSAPGEGIDEAFSGQTINMDITIPGWENVAVKGTRKWQAKLFSGNLYAQSTAFNDTAPAMETWLITPEVDTDKTPTLTFESAKAFWFHDGLTVWVTTNYTGNPTTSTWTKINARVAVNADADNAFIPSGNIDLKSFGAKVKVGFKYEGVGGTNTSSYRLDNIKIQ